ncbi:MAG: DUF58 domain-containing protein [Verrucomicrobiota bacterium]
MPAQNDGFSPLGRKLSEARALARAGSPVPPPLPVKFSGTQVVPTLAESERAKREAVSRQLAMELLNAEELERFRNLIVFARTAVESRFSGRHRSPDLGGGGEFTEFQAYFPGFPVQAIDWRVFARTRRLVIRRYRQETDMDVHLVVDASGSMRYAGGGRTRKGERAARIAAALAYLMLRQGDKASLTLFADRVLDHIAPAGTRRHLQQMLRALVKPAHNPGGGTDLPAALRECGRLFRRRGKLVVVSDFLGCEPAQVLDALGLLLHRGFEILLMRVRDPDEETLPDAPLARFVDLETGASVDVEPEEIRARFEELTRRRDADYADGAARHGADFIVVSNDRPYRDAIEAYLGFRTPSARRR